VAEWELDGVTVETDYQLHVEHAADAAEYDVVIFADADVEGAGPFRFRRLEPKTELSFTSHSVSPAGVLGLARELFSARSRGYVLGIRGHAFGEFAEGLSEEARRNLSVPWPSWRQRCGPGAFRKPPTLTSLCSRRADECRSRR
jgi:hydrogenase maturation protease